MRTSGVRGTHRLSAPPSASLRGRATVAAVATGALVAAGQSAFSRFEPHGLGVEHVTASAVLPVAADPVPRPDAPITVGAVGGDQLAADTLALPVLDEDSRVDVESLTKAVDIGRELAERAALIEAALSEGAAEAVVRGSSAFVRPVTGRVTSSYGPRWGTTHYGLDVANSIGTPIYAVTDAVVEKSGPASGFGLWVVLRHPDGTKSVYGHINRTFVEVGQRVAAGEQIAEVGNRGRSTGPHLHFEAWDVDGTKLDPMAWLGEQGISF